MRFEEAMGSPGEVFCAYNEIKGVIQRFFQDHEDMAKSLQGFCLMILLYEKCKQGIGGLQKIFPKETEIFTTFAKMVVESELYGAEYTEEMLIKLGIDTTGPATS